MSGRVFAEHGPWLFSRRTDLLAFGGSALLSLLLVALGYPLGLVDHDAPMWTFLVCVVAVDVAHVWSTGFRVYFDGDELRAHPWLYLGVPALAYLLGVALHAVSALVFWRALAYLAVFHFVRQQAGFMRLYARQNPHQTQLDTLLEQASIYAATLYPLLYWHAHIPRAFTWLVQGDFLEDAWLHELCETCLPSAEIACCLSAALFVLRQAVLLQRGTWVPGKSLLLATTLSCWVLGIVVFDSDYVFTVTNVLIHGVPYFVLTHRYARAASSSRGATDAPSSARLGLQRLVAAGFVPCLLLCIALAAVEEALWEGLVWHEHTGALRVESPLAGWLLVFVVPALAVPQITHYVLDGLVWRVRRQNPVLRRELESA